jgi:NADH:ubiquinone oxidoreductase subunit 5 (subunit L)/multisubunit Na+/H+ antiporter MnhA subunit
MILPLIVLATGAAVAGYLGYNDFVGEGREGFWRESILVLPDHQSLEAAHHAPDWVGNLPFVVGLLGIAVAWLAYIWRPDMPSVIARAFRPLYLFLLNKWYFDELYGTVVVGGTLAYCSLLRKFDNRVVDGLVNGTASWTKGIVFGYNAHWKERPINSRFFLVIGIFITGIVAAYTFMWLRGPEYTIWGAAEAGLGAFCAALLTFFFFWGGAGGFDKYVVDGFVNGVAYMSGFGGIVLRKFQTGRVQTYIVFVIIGVMVLFFVFR